MLLPIRKNGRFDLIILLFPLLCATTNAEGLLSVENYRSTSALEYVERNDMPKNKKPVGVDRCVWEEHRDKAVCIISSTTDQMGFLVVEIDEIRKFDDILIRLVVWSDNGVSIADLARISKRAMRGFENDHDLRTSGLSDILRLDVSSPGIYRIIKNLEELNIFNGKEITIHAEENGNKISVTGTNRGYQDNVVRIEVKDKIVQFEDKNIERVRLAG